MKPGLKKIKKLQHRSHRWAYRVNLFDFDYYMNCALASLCIYIRACGCVLVLILIRRYSEIKTHTYKYV